MIHPDDYEKIFASVSPQFDPAEDEPGDMDMEYRIIRKNGETRWIDGHGHYVVSDVYRGLHYVFISDVTDQHRQAESDKVLRAAVPAAWESYSRNTPRKRSFLLLLACADCLM